ncbi:carbamate kinase [Klebsiella michiganensis]|uniref:carbamate kinase n=1 Tax=Klebsiella michiganensis TaxID=1134687 RepID=UPI002DBF84E9|nr:carbamate kinase [Klebsiella michiganensis]MEB8289609.1 carbamate kinase [Klebsiella michiganensis]
MKIAIALGGNALLRRNESMTAENQRSNIELACRAIARLGEKHQLILSHGNGPQIGLLSLQADAYADKLTPYPFDILGAETQGMIGYLFAQELRNAMPSSEIAAVLTQVEVDEKDPALKHPTKFIGPVYTREVAEMIAQEKGWTIKSDGQYYRRVVPSPRPKSILEIASIRALVDAGTVVVACGGGGIPVTIKDDMGKGLEAVIDKDLCCGLLADKLEADLLILATDVKCVFIDYGKPEAKAIRAANPQALAALSFSAGSMGPKIEATCEFVSKTGNRAMIGALDDIERMVAGDAGTTISSDVDGIIFY